MHHTIRNVFVWDSTGNGTYELPTASQVTSPGDAIIS